MVQPDAWLTEAIEQVVKVFYLTFFAPLFLYSLHLLPFKLFVVVLFHLLSAEAGDNVFFFLAIFKLPSLIFCPFLASRRTGSSGGAGGRGG